jgi:hypothetical protein
METYYTFYQTRTQIKIVIEQKPPLNTWKRVLIPVTYCLNYFTIRISDITSHLFIFVQSRTAPVWSHGIIQILIPTSSPWFVYTDDRKRMLKKNVFLTMTCACCLYWSLTYPHSRKTEIIKVDWCVKSIQQPIAETKKFSQRLSRGLLLKFCSCPMLNVLCTFFFTFVSI